MRYDPRNGAVSEEEVLPYWRGGSIPVQAGRDLFAYYEGEGELSKYTFMKNSGWTREKKNVLLVRLCAQLWHIYQQLKPST